MASTKFKMMDFIKEISKLSPRLFENQLKTGKIIKKHLNDSHISFTVQSFETKVPKVIKASLFVDNEKIDCKATTFVSGEITNNKVVVDVTEYDESAYKYPNLNYNSLCNGISQATHFPVPSLAFNKNDLKKVLKASVIKGEVKVIPTNHQSENILVGNITNPKNILFCHYDSLGGGALDNASGTALCLSLIINHPQLLNDNLFVLSSDEELSYEPDIYWGKGYREFEKDCLPLLKSAQRIYCVDGVGVDRSTAHQREIEEFIPIKNIKKLLSKTYAISGAYKPAMAVYHCDNDTPKVLKQKYLQQAQDLILNLL